ncbi:hypothetical protein [Thiomonas bhubaneswarensis]|uniref:Uncharacterized protein n=1 Tax=Thiomonas bhubaneswarensis TaxID=339866 RepID=A0A0K6I158_9BURK|nr:hypothetical protein [Thiomonas bhubaneswarensis]CUA96894.1 hypothetical protein Ga0061069_10516 [Thiomonas bhubaneswarensis]
MMHPAHTEAGRGGETTPRPQLSEMLLAVVQALVEQGWGLPQIVAAMRYTADLTEFTDRVTGVPQ